MDVTAAFAALCNDPWGEPARIQFNIMFVGAGVGGSTNVVADVTNTQEVVSISAIASRREKKHGIMQGQSWQIQTTNTDNEYTSSDYSDAYGQIIVEFTDASESEPIVQGRIYKTTASTNGTMTFEVHDTVIDLLNYEIPRDIHYQDTGWLGEMQVYSKDPDSDGWDSTVDLAITSAPDLEDETFYVTFTSSVAFDVTRDGGAGTQSGTTALPKSISNNNGAVLSIPSSGWSGTYASGDVFVFYSAAPRVAADLAPGAMIMDLIDEAVPSVPVISATPAAGNAFYDSTNWAAFVTDTAGDEIGGFWPKGTPVSRMIQDALKIIHGSIYSVPNGRLAIWHLSPNTDTRVSLNGDPEQGTVSIIEASTAHDLTEKVSAVTYEYLDLEGNDAAVTSTDADTVLITPKIETVRIGWRARGLSVESAANIHLNRLKAGRREYTVKATLAGLLADVGAGVSITDPDIDLTVEASDVTEISMDLLNNKVTIKAHVDPVVIEDYAIVEIATVGGTEVVW